MNDPWIVEKTSNDFIVLICNNKSVLEIKIQQLNIFIFNRDFSYFYLYIVHPYNEEIE